MKKKNESRIFISKIMLAMTVSFMLIFLVQPASAKTLLTQSDFKYIGAFALPDTVSGGGDPTFGNGMALRYVNGQLHMFSSTLNPSDIYEVIVPTISASGTPVATVYKNWGEDWWDKSYIDGSTKTLYGIYWDEASKRLYYSFGNDYTPSGSDSAFGYMTLNDAAGTSTPVGSYGFNKGQKSAMSCIIPIPQWFADTYLNAGGSKKLGAGCGGYFSMVSYGGVSMGPAMAAFNPPTSSTADRAMLPYTDLVDYPFSSGAYSTPDRAHRNTNYNADASDGDWLGWPAKNGIGYWTGGDSMHQAGVWIDTPTKSGLLYIPILISGRLYYGAGNYVDCDGYSYWWFMYDPTDLATVAQGQKKPWEIQPAAEWQAQSGIGSESQGALTGGQPPAWITGVTFDPTNNRLYIGAQFAASGGQYGATKIFVYEVQSNSTVSPPTNTSITGDINSDGTVNIADLQMIVNDFGKTSGFNSAVDLAAPTGTINLFDVMVVIKNWGRTS